VNVLVSESVARACPGGTGSVKAGGNYAVTLQVTRDAAQKGCSQVLFLDPLNHRMIEEMGGMNVFLVRNGELLTPPLSDTILEGITRDTILHLAADLGIKATETALDIEQVVEEISDGTISEALACGTAAAVTGIGALHFESGPVVRIGEGQPGPITSRLYERLVGIQYGDYPDEHGWVHEVCRVDAVVER
jgi:branched-chain amino acid aminotransferase